MDNSTLTTIPPPSYTEVGIRIGLAVLAGMLVGIERESRGRAAGFRTTTIVCVAGALATIISEIAFSQTAATGSSWRPDPLRLAAGLMSGMGFLGAGTIVRNENIVRGVTTAATLWVATVLGLAFGAGQIFVGLLGLVVTLAVLTGLSLFEGTLERERFARLAVTMELDSISEEQLREKILAYGASIKSYQLEYDFAAQRKTILSEISIKKSQEYELARKFIAELRQIKGVFSVSYKY